ncbi:perilipin 6 [Osmerus eperlanus]|uniref:perilipin 6 n=1 Tax=Osmerus eperlanus TaxID=29151 RepID=UPI002E126B2F
MEKWNENSWNNEANVVQRVVHLPLVRSVAQSVASAYKDVKGRYPFIHLVGVVAELGVRNMSQAALQRATPLLESLEPQIEVANEYACVGLDQLEKSFPVLHQSSEEVVDHLKDAFFLTLDNMQLQATDMAEQLAVALSASIAALQGSQLGRTATASLDEVLTRLEEVTAHYMPLPLTLRREWELMMQQYDDEDEDENEEVGILTRFRGLLLSLGLQLYHRLSKLRERLDQVVTTLGNAADKVGLSRVLAMMGLVLQRLQILYVALVFRVEALRDLALGQIRRQAQVLVELGPIRQVRELPVQVQLLLGEVQELGMIALQLLVNTTPLYNMIEQPSDQEVEDFLNREDFISASSSRRSSANSLFLKAMDGRPPRRKSLYARPRRGSASGTTNPPAPDHVPASPTNSKEPPIELETLVPQTPPSPSFSDTIRRRSSASELLLGPIMQLVSQGQKAFEYLSPEVITHVEENAED